MNNNDSPESGADVRLTTAPTGPTAAPFHTVRDAPAPSSPPTPAPHPLVSILDKVGELAAIVGFIYTCIAGRISGEMMVGAVLAVVSVNTGLRQIGAKVTGAGHGLGVVGLVVAGASGYGAHVVHGLRVLLPGLLGAFVLLSAAGCASGPRSTDSTARTVLTATQIARKTVCDDTLTPYLGRVPALSIDAPVTTVPAAIGQIRAWLCADPLGAILDTVTELLAPTPASTPSTRTSTTPTPPPVTPSSEPVTHAPELVTHAPELVTHAPELVTQPPAPVAQTQDGGTP